MMFKPAFPTKLHQDVAELVRDYFHETNSIDTVLVVNSCARGQAIPESDLDFAILTKPGVSPAERMSIETSWQSYSETQPTLLQYKQSNIINYIIGHIMELCKNIAYLIFVNIYIHNIITTISDYVA